MQFDLLGFEDLYFKVREKEGRIYSDSELKNLPQIASSHAYYKEWRIRRFSSTRLIHYLKKRKEALKLLEIGCGNGWLSNQISQIQGSEIMALDPHESEILQARRVFTQSNITFMYGEFNKISVQNLKFDVVLFAASIQYFPSLKDILNSSLELLSPDGEILILDSPLYPPAEIGDAKRRTENYYSGLGYPEMAQYYFHPNWEDLDNFSYKILFNPDSFLNRLIRKEPFYSLSVPKRANLDPGNL